MVDDAEGATKVSHIRVVGAESDAAAHQAARKVADSMLVQCSLNGEDPYWGRVVSELGSAGVAFDIDRVSVAYGGSVVCAGGVAWTTTPTAVTAHMAGRHIEIVVRPRTGDGRPPSWAPTSATATSTRTGPPRDVRRRIIRPGSDPRPRPLPKITRAQKAAAHNTASLLVEALPYIQRFRGKVVVVKYGGNALHGSAGGASTPWPRSPRTWC